MPIDAASAPVLPAVPATQSQPLSDMAVQPAEPLRVHVSTSEQPATFSTGAPLEARAQVGTPDGPPRGVEDDGTPRVPAIPMRSMQWGLEGFLAGPDKQALRSTSGKLNEAITTHETNPHVKASLEADERLWDARLRDKPTLQASVDAKAAKARLKAYHRVVNELTNRLHRHRTELSHAIADANKSHSVPYDMDQLCWSAVGALNECGQFERAIEIMELRMAYADDAPTKYGYVKNAKHLVASGKSSLAVELIRRVQDPKTDYPGLHFSLAAAQVRMGDYAGALLTIEALSNDARWPEVAAAANYKLAMLKPEGAERATLLAESDIALEVSLREFEPGVSHQTALAGLYFDMDRVEEAMHCLETVMERLGVERYYPYRHASAVLDRPSVRYSPRWDFILASPVWAEYARVTGDPNPAHELMDRQSIEFSFDLPAIIAPPRHKILSVRDLEAQMTPSQDTRPRGDSEAKR